MLHNTKSASDESLGLLHNAITKLRGYEPIGINQILMSIKGQEKYYFTYYII